MAETFAQLGRIEAIRQLFEGSGYEPFGEPLWFTADGGECVTTASKVLLEGIDFNLEYFPLKHLGYKSVIAATGELYAVMSHPETLRYHLECLQNLTMSRLRNCGEGC